MQIVAITRRALNGAHLMARARKSEKQQKTALPKLWNFLVTNENSNKHRRPKSIHQYCAKKSPTTTSKALWCICIYLSFSLENKLFGIHQTSFLPVEALEFSELKTPLVYTFFPPKTAKNCKNLPAVSCLYH